MLASRWGGDALFPHSAALATRVRRRLREEKRARPAPAAPAADGNTDAITDARKEEEDQEEVGPSNSLSATQLE